jgi:hypothetical protein
MTYQRVWSEDMIGRLQVLIVDEKASINAAAMALSTEFNVPISRNAISGALHRMGLRTVTDCRYRPPVQVPRGVGEPDVESPRRESRKPIARQIEQDAAEQSEIAADRLKRREAQYSRDRWSCQFIAGDPREGAEMCGKPREFGQPWCSEHAGVCFSNHARSGRPFILEGQR